MLEWLLLMSRMVIISVSGQIIALSLRFSSWWRWLQRESRLYGDDGVVIISLMRERMLELIIFLIGLQRDPLYHAEISFRIFQH